MNKKTVIGIVLIAVMAIAVTYLAIMLGNGMNEQVSKFSPDSKPVSVLEAQLDSKTNAFAIALVK